MVNKKQLKHGSSMLEDSDRMKSVDLGRVSPPPPPPAAGPGHGDGGAACPPVFEKDYGIAFENPVQELEAVEEDDGAEPSLSEAGPPGSGDSGDTPSPDQRSEWILVRNMALPLLLTALATNASTAGSQIMWGHLSTSALASGALALTFQYNTMVFIMGAQQAIYTMVPQASGAGNLAQVSAQLTMFMLWTCIYMGIPTTVLWWFMGELFLIGGVGEGYGYGYADSGTAMATANETLIEIDYEEISRYSRASATWVITETGATTLECWLHCVGIVTPGSIIFTVATVFSLPVAWLFMFADSVGGYFGTKGKLEGFAYAHSLVCVTKFLALWLVVFVWMRAPQGGRQGKNTKYWRGLDVRSALAPRMNAHFIVLSAPQIGVYILDASAHTFYYSWMAQYGAQQVAAYGVGDGWTWTGGCITLVLYTACSVRVGTRLGEGDIPRAKEAAVVGLVYSFALGVTISILIFLFREQLAHLFSPTDADVRYLLTETMGPVLVFYVLRSVQYALWATMEGQMRIYTTFIIISVSSWLISIPIITWIMPSPDQVVASSGGLPSTSLIRTMWYIQCIGMVVSNLLLGYCILKSNWPKLVEVAQRELTVAKEEAELAHETDGLFEFVSGDYSTVPIDAHAVKHSGVRGAYPRPCRLSVLRPEADEIRVHDNEHVLWSISQFQGQHNGGEETLDLDVADGVTFIPLTAVVPEDGSECGALLQPQPGYAVGPTKAWYKGVNTDGGYGGLRGRGEWVVPDNRVQSYQEDCRVLFIHGGNHSW